MSNDPDFERDLDRLMARIELPQPDRWVPRAAVGTGRGVGWLFPAAAASLVVVLALAVGAQTVGDGAASRSPRMLTSPPLLTRPPSSIEPSFATSGPPRGSGILRAAGTILDFTEDAGSMAADGQALAAVVTRSASSSIVVTEIGRQRYTIAATMGRTQVLSPHGALSGDLIAYTEIEAKDTSAPAPVVVWHVMVANWRTGAVRELDAIPGEQSIAPHSPDYMPNVYTNGRDVLWLRTPRASGQLGASELVLWRSGVTTIIWRGDWRNEISYALADDGRVAVVALACPPRERVGFCPSGTRWELYVLGSDLTPRLITWRDAFGDRGSVGGPPAFAGSHIAWARVSGAPVKVTTVDVVEIATGNARAITDEACAWIGTTVTGVVFECPDTILHTYPVSGAITRVESNEQDTRYFVADPHAIIGRRSDNSWVIRPVQ